MGYSGTNAGPIAEFPKPKVRTTDSTWNGVFALDKRRLAGLPVGASGPAYAAAEGERSGREQRIV